MLAQLLTGRPLAPSKSKAEEIALSALDKKSLEMAIAAHTQSGWKLRLRTHSSEGEHSATLFRNPSV